MSQFSSPQLQQINQSYMAEMKLPELAKPITKEEPCARHYTITPFDPNGHLFTVEFRIAFPAPKQRLSLPNWIPGSYLIRDFSKHLIDLQAYDDAQTPLTVTPVDKSTWEVDSSGNAFTIKYQVYAWDLSVRGAHFDDTHAFFNGTSVFLEAEGQRDFPCVMSLKKSPVCVKNAWKVATGMPSLEVDHHGFGHYHAENYLALIDYPVEIGSYVEIDFRACGVPHKMVLTGVFNCDLERLKSDLTTICEYEIRLFGEAAPFDNYLFQVMVTGSDYGGLEHRNSTALICSRNDLPYEGMQKPTEGYLQFLELCSHEYFHSWNVKRIMPKAYQNPDLSQPIYSRQLWWFEGVTSYYDALILQRCGLIDEQTYLDQLGKQLTRVYRMPGRFKQSVADSSFFAWTKFYQQDENAPNAIISYYTKGSLVALALDLLIREKTQGKKSLDTVLLHLWQHFGSKGIGLEEFEIERICSEVSGIDLKDFFTQLLDQTEDYDLATLFSHFGVNFTLRNMNSLADTGGQGNTQEQLAVDFGANLEETANQTLAVRHVWQERTAQLAGLSSGDEIIAINDLRVTSKSQLESLLKRAQIGDKWTCSYFRRDELRQCRLVLTASTTDRVELSFKEPRMPQNEGAVWLENPSNGVNNDV
ncbi:M61 family metallopeptidase [Thiomicrorhabdus xiamenensis]|nr:PDZ domain-containing protein [Thiomicrorhabdus xiamenensis]